MKKKGKKLLIITIVLFMILTLGSGCGRNQETNPSVPDKPVVEEAAESDSVNDPESNPPEKGPEGSEMAAEDLAAAAVKYYEYFAKYNTRINPLFNFSPDKADDTNLMVFAILNVPGYSYEQGNSKEEIDAVLTKFFGRTVQNYVTGMTEYVPGTDRIRAIGWDVGGSNRLVLTKLLTRGNGNFTGHFDVYHIPELYGGEDYQQFWSEIDDLLLSGKPGKYAELLSYKAVIDFTELPEEGGGFYLRYNSIRILELESPLWGTYAGYEMDERSFDPQARFAAAEASFNGITTSTTKKELLAKLGEPWEIIENPQDVTIGSTTYIYAGVEYVFEGASDTVSCIRVTGFQWKYGPRNIRLGDSFEDVISRFPQERDYKSHPNGCFYGENTYLEEGGAVYFNSDGSVAQITLVPKEILPFVKIYFEDGLVSGYEIIGSTN